MLGLNSFKNKVVLVTGSTRGLGLELVKEFSEAKTFVYLNGKRAGEVKKCIRKINKPNVFPAAGDLSKEENIKEIIQKIKRKFHRLDFLINNAGVYSSKDFIETSYNELLDNLKVNLLGHIHLTLLAAKLMSKNKFGQIINISSGSGEHGGLLPSFGYALSKNAFIFLAKILPKELNAHNIFINTFVIRFMRTKTYEEFRKYYKKRFKKDFVTRLKIYEPNEVAKKILKFLKLAEKKKISGKIIHI